MRLWPTDICVCVCVRLCLLCIETNTNWLHDSWRRCCCYCCVFKHLTFLNFIGFLTWLSQQQIAKCFFEIESVTFLWVEKVKLNRTLTAIDSLCLSTTTISIQPLLAIVDTKRLKSPNPPEHLHSIGFSRAQIESRRKENITRKKTRLAFHSIALFKVQNRWKINDERNGEGCAQLIHFLAFYSIRYYL